MNEEKKIEELEKIADLNQDHIYEVMDQLISVAHVDSAFSEPVTHGDTTVITVSEIASTAFVGYGGGFGTFQPEKSDQKIKEGGGNGGGGGGLSLVRPVAVVKICDNEVSIIPVIDKTKLMIAVFTLLGSIILILSKMMLSSKAMYKHFGFRK